MTILLNAARVRARRLELNLSERQLSAITGLGQSVVRSLEAGTNHKDLTLGEVTRLAAALAVDVTQLLTHDQPAERTGAAEPAAKAGELQDEPLSASATATDVSRVGALLHDVDRLIPVESLAVTAELSLERTHAVLRELDSRLRPTGLRLHRLGNTVRICADVDAADAATLRTLWRAHLSRRGLDLGQVHTLHQVRAGRRGKTLTNDQQVTVRQLTNAGLLTRTASGGAELSDDVRYSLLLDELAPAQPMEAS